MKSSPASCTTLIELLQFRAINSGNETAFIINDKRYTYAWLWENTRRYASALYLSGIKKNDTVLILVPNSAEFFIAFYGCMLSGAIAVPVFPKAGADRCLQLIKLCGSRHIILPENADFKKKIEFLAPLRKRKIQIHWVNENTQPVSKNVFPKRFKNDIAFIQYTSGSTIFPKGVPLSHKNLLTNVTQMAEALNITKKDVFVSWLPVYHDMGLILNTMAPMYTGAILILLSEGLQKVYSWLSAIQKYKGTVITAPDIAYRHCVKSIRDHSNYDLSSLRIALNASEPVHLQTFRLFEETFGLKNVMIAGYGLAEATLAVTIHPPGHLPKTDKAGHLSSGKPLKEIKIRIAKVKNKSGDINVGEILVKGPATMKGYFNNKQQIKSFDKKGYLHTGDVGYIDKGGFLFVLSRKKNIIIQGGQTIYPDDVEEVVRSIKEVRQAMAIGIEMPVAGGERLFVFAESKWQECSPLTKCHELAIEIVQKIYDHFGFRPAAVYILKPKSLPVTPNGKLRHSELKNVYLDRLNLFRKNILYPKKD